MDIQSLVAQFGGGVPLARKLSEMTGQPISEEAIYKWVKRRQVPPRWHFPLLDLAEREAIVLTRDDLSIRIGEGISTNCHEERQ